MTRTIKFIGNFMYQVDLIKPGHRNSVRLDVVGQTEYELPLVKKTDLVAGAATFRIPDEIGALKKFSYDGWDGALWSPLGSIVDNNMPTKNPKSLIDYRVDFTVDWVRNASFHYLSDPLRRAYGGDLSPIERGRLIRFPRDGKTTVAEASLDGKVSWSNREDCLRRHLASSKDLIVVDDIMYVRRPDPVWATFVNEKLEKKVRLTIPVSWISSDSDEIPHSFDGKMMMNMEVVRADRAEYAMRGGHHTTGEIVSLDPRFLSRDDDAWTLLCRLRPILENSLSFFRFLPPDAVVSMKRLTDAFDSSSMWDLSPITEQKEQMISDLKTLARGLKSVPTPPRLATHRDYALKYAADALRQIQEDRPLHPDDEAGVTSLAAEMQ